MAAVGEQFIKILQTTRPGKEEEAEPDPIKEKRAQVREKLRTKTLTRIEGYAEVERLKRELMASDVFKSWPKKRQKDELKRIDESFQQILLGLK